MEIVSFAKEVLQDVVEHAASYRFGQTVLRQCDRALWVVEKCARWAVPPTLDQDERPQPELIRPLPWVFFLILLVSLRITREAISLVNLIMGKPPLRSADVVMYIQSKRRYLRTLKYSGSRAMRARTASAQPPQNWFAKMQSLFEVTMCFRGRQTQYGNNNTSTNNEELLVVKRSKRARDTPSASVASETSMERLIEKMMVDLDADSDEDTSYTLTNPTSVRSDPSDTAESDQETICHNESTSTNSNDTVTSSTPNQGNSPKKENINEVSPIKEGIHETSPKAEGVSMNNDVASSTPEKLPTTDNNINESLEANLPETESITPKKGSQMFIQNEKYGGRNSSPKNSPPKEQKIANGRAMSAPGKKRGNYNERRDADASVTKKADRSF